MDQESRKDNMNLVKRLVQQTFYLRGFDFAFQTTYIKYSPEILNLFFLYTLLFGNLEATILMSINRWSEIGQQAAQAKEVYIQNQVVKIFSIDVSIKARRSQCLRKLT